MTPLEDYLDQEFTAAIERAREKFPENRDDFNGHITAFMLITAVTIARNNGCPKHVLQAAVSGYIKKRYGS